MKKGWIIIGAFILFQCGTPKKDKQSEEDGIVAFTESEEEFNKRMEWWRDAGFGMFIHWGPYAVPAGIHNGENVEGISEWIMNSARIPVEEYEQYSAQFNPEYYNATNWVKTAKKAGMRYIIITSKHHDGFCLWDSKITDYDAVDFAPIQRDLLAELAAACKKERIKLGFYHSIMDWHHPDAQAPHYPTYNSSEKKNPNFDRYYRDYLKPQVGELIEKYDPAVMWFDGEWIPEYTHEQGLDMDSYVRSLKPNILVNNRVDKGRKGMQGMNEEGMDYAGDFGTPEQEILEGTSTYDWESCMTMNDSWGYKSWDDNWKSEEMLIHNLVDIAAKGGNYLLNVGPTAEGRIPRMSGQRLAAIGEWMKVNRDVVYKSRSLKDYKEGESTYYVTNKSGSRVFVVATEWPGHEFSFSQVVPADSSEIKMLGYDQPLDWNRNQDGIVVVKIPEDLQDPENRPCDYAWTFRVSI